MLGEKTQYFFIIICMHLSLRLNKAISSEWHGWAKLLVLHPRIGLDFYMDRHSFKCKGRTRGSIARLSLFWQGWRFQISVTVRISMQSSFWKSQDYFSKLCFLSPFVDVSSVYSYPLMPVIVSRTCMSLVF